MALSATNFNKVFREFLFEEALEDSNIEGIASIYIMTIRIEHLPIYGGVLGLLLSYDQNFQHWDVLVIWGDGRSRIVGLTVEVGGKITFNYGIPDMRWIIEKYNFRCVVGELSVSPSTLFQHVMQNPLIGTYYRLGSNNCQNFAVMLSRSFFEGFQIQTLSSMPPQAMAADNLTHMLRLGEPRADTEQRLITLQVYDFTNHLDDLFILGTINAFGNWDLNMLNPQSQLFRNVENHKELSVALPLGEFDVKLYCIPVNNGKRHWQYPQGVRQNTRLRITNEVNRIVLRWGMAGPSEAYT